MAALSKGQQAAIRFPYRWYRRWGWQVALMMLNLFIAWIIWAAIGSSERNALYRSIELAPNARMIYSAPDWIRELAKTTWVPAKIARFAPNLLSTCRFGAVSA